MLQVSNFCPRFLILPSEMVLPKSLLHYFPAPAERLGAASIYRSKESFDRENEQIESDLHGQEYVRIFENFWLPSRTSDDTRKMLVRSLFSAISSNYDSIVTPEHNFHCYEHLYALAKELLHRTPDRVLDFGCGTGLITQTKIGSQVSVLKGFDFCPKMAALARGKGLDVIEGSIQAIEKEAYDLVLASYVFHYGLTHDDWTMLLSCVTAHGAVLGNFHKGIGLEYAIATLACLKEHCTYQVTESDFGPVLVAFVAPQGH
ncbi:class I SAM-dependent DNA methyltransferase [Janthinobacterium sp. FT14W]|uniref:class I SAM-dependent DNA methyltransferase n=1 Tax=Janthinobacterium sp. FT14W TaxID=2654253 RepID=UPI00186B472F|nr:methyltransferase domain-containing protein [Janthinobacterium sp. FT14W]